MTSRFIQTQDDETFEPFEPDTFWNVFHHQSTQLGDMQLHYVEGGNGPPILLLPGWPQSWYAWRYVMPLLAAAGRRVIALDPRGMGDSDRPVQGYDMTTVAADIHNFLQAVGMLSNGPIDVVGHDVGTWIGYAHAADWPGDVRRLALLDSALPGISPPPPPGIPSAEANIKSWHFAFNRLDDLPEILLQGREREFLTWLFRAKSVRSYTISSLDIDEYVRVNAGPVAIRAALSYYRQNFDSEAIAASKVRSKKKLSMPVLAIGAEAGVGDRLLNTMQLVATNVEGRVFGGCGHYVPEEAPRAVVEEILRFMPA